MVELPPYRLPSVKPIVIAAAARSWAFLQRAAPVIFTVGVCIWVLGYFPGEPGTSTSPGSRALGHWLEPVFRPMGADWKAGVGIVTSFAAREVFVGTMGTLNGLEDAGTQLGALSTQLHLGGMGLAGALALIAFYSLSLQCASTLAVMRKETGSAPGAGPGLPLHDHARVPGRGDDVPGRRARSAPEATPPGLRRYRRGVRLPEALLLQKARHRHRLIR